MRAVVDSSTLISLAWSGQLRLLTHVPIDLVVPDEVRQETVVGGLDRGYPDAAAIELAIKDIPNTDAVGDVHADSVDNVVLEAARADGVLFTNDLALGRRAANLGVQWLRTADLVVLCVRSGQLNAQDGVTALRALRSAGRITDNLLREYLRELS